MLDHGKGMPRAPRAYMVCSYPTSSSSDQKHRDEPFLFDNGHHTEHYRDISSEQTSATSSNVLARPLICVYGALACMFRDGFSHAGAGDHLKYKNTNCATESNGTSVLTGGTVGGIGTARSTSDS
jgi:hypothetical protein